MISRNGPFVMSLMTRQGFPDDRFGPPRERLVRIVAESVGHVSRAATQCLEHARLDVPGVGRVSEITERAREQRFAAAIEPASKSRNPTGKRLEQDDAEAF